MGAGSLAEVVLQARDIVVRYAGKSLTEQDTKNAIIEPILGALGWPKADLERVRAEYRHTSTDNPADYALFERGRPVMFVEAKALDKDLNDQKFTNQVISYGAVAGVSWALITNGRRWDLYRTFVDRIAAQNRVLFSTTVEAPDFQDWMAWITPAVLAGNQLEQMWRRMVAERKVRATIEQMFAERDASFVKSLMKRTGLNKSDVALALQGLQPTFASTNATGTPDPKPADPSTGTRSNGKKHPVVLTLVPEGGPRSPFHAPPQSGSKPTRMGIGEEQWDIKTWRDVITNAVDHVRRNRPDQYEALFDSEHFRGKKRPYASRHPDLMASPYEVPGGFLELNLSATGAVTVARRALELAGVDADGAWYEVAAKVANDEATSA